MARNSRPRSATLRTYQVGFGDCFLLTFHYVNERDRHVLIDFGSSGLEDSDAADGRLLRIAQDVQKRSGRKLDIVVATHRHKDHINGFATNNKGTGPGDIIAACHPDYVIQPWTEHPDAQPDAEHAPGVHESSKSFVASLQAMHEVSRTALGEIKTLSDTLRPEMVAELGFVGGINLPNRSAVENLIRMAKKGKKAFFVNYGSKLGNLLPGVKITVLGPPDLTQTEETRKQRSRDKDEFWHFQAMAGRFSTDGPLGLFEHAEVFVGGEVPPYTRWFIDKLKGIRGEQLLGIVRALDKEMNNTSVILLFEAGGKKLLFPGDAQIENWSYALTKKDVQSLLKSVNLYKVGHHGSMNATPRQSLWELFENRSTKPKPSRLRTVVSTMANKHGNAEKGTEVPRQSLIKELKQHTDFFSTEELKRELSKDFEIRLEA